MIKILKSVLGSINKPHFVEYKQLHLPPFRTNQALENNEDYLASGIEQVNFLKKENYLGENTVFLDFGCGQGRIANCLEYSDTKLEEYTGLDTDKKSIDWCKKYLINYKYDYQFIHLPAFNKRYNDGAIGLLPLPFKKSKFDLIFLNSVFSHMLEKDVKFYLNEFYKVLTLGGFVYVTAFIEENVKSVEENPSNYLDESLGPLHRVRYEKDFFFTMIEQSNLVIHKFLHQHILRTRQSVIILTKKN